MGLVFPHVETRSQVDSFRHFMFYPPEGVRPAYGGPNRDYVLGPGATLNKSANENMMLVVLIESRLGVERIDEIVDGGGIDVVQVGGGDLSYSYGFPGERRHPLVLEAIDRVVAACNRRDIPVGCTCDSYDDAKDLLKRGLRWLNYPLDLYLLMRAFSESVRCSSL